MRRRADHFTKLSHPAPGGQKRPNLASAHACRVPKTVEPDGGAHPIDMNIPCPYAVMQIADALTQLIEYFLADFRSGRGGTLPFMAVEYCFCCSHRAWRSCLEGGLATAPHRVRELAAESGRKTVSL